MLGTLPRASILRLRRALLRWYWQEKRDLPWRGSRDPYAIWLSEVMLQQTRAAAVVPYFNRFLSRYPSPRELAAASEPEVLAEWAGLGYYSRARNLHRAAKSIAAHGTFPSDYDSLRALPGVGDYTAAAVASIAYGLPHAVLDGNVLRVLSRFTAESGSIDASATRQRLRDSAQSLLDPKQPGEFNQAMMELGATLCAPRDPDCSQCPLSSECLACLSNRQNEFPFKKPQKKIVETHKRLLLIQEGESLLFWQRPVGGKRLGGFWELPEPAQLPGVTLTRHLGIVVHGIVRTKYVCEVWQASARSIPEGYRWLNRDSMARFPLSAMAAKALALLRKQ